MTLKLMLLHVMNFSMEGQAGMNKHMRAAKFGCR